MKAGARLWRQLVPERLREQFWDRQHRIRQLIDSGSFGLLHFACRNTYDPARGSSIRLGNVQFTPTLLEMAVIQKVDGWASRFLEAGAAAFIGSLWAVSDGTAREFAQELYGSSGQESRWEAR
jgi:hypothetical protein